MFVDAFERELLGRSGTIAPDSLCHSYSKLTAVAIDADLRAGAPAWYRWIPARPYPASATSRL